jgi:phosphoribosylglycinamide formyltransferase-1
MRVMQHRLGMLLSGGGRTVLNIAAECRTGSLDASIALVIAHRDDIVGVARCREAGLRVAVLPDGEALAERIDAVLEAADVDLVCLAGYLRHFRVGTRWRGRTINIHPGLLPQFGGLGMYGMRVHRAVHEVDEVYDRGPVLIERRCVVDPLDTADTLASRVFALECEAFPAAIRLMCARTDTSARCLKAAH